MKDPVPGSLAWKLLHLTYTSARRLAVAVIGATILLIGIAMLVLPGPAVIVIPAGLAILSAEFAFARRWLRLIKRQARSGLHQLGLNEHPALYRAYRLRQRRQGTTATASVGEAAGHQPE